MLRSRDARCVYLDFKFKTEFQRYVHQISVGLSDPRHQDDVGADLPTPLCRRSAPAAADVAAPSRNPPDKNW